MANATLEIDLVTVADVDGFDDVGTAARDMSSKVDQASRTIDTASSRIDRAADASDTLASKSSQATGGLGALASGMELVGAEKYGVALQSAALATDFFSGVGDIANLVMSSQAVEFIKARVAAVAHTVATGAQTAATIAQTAAQKALNLAMKANPIGLIITAATLLVAGFVLLYKKSETFREGVQKAGQVGKAALGFIIDRGRDLIGWFSDALGWVESKIPGGFGTLRTVASKAMDVVLSPFRRLVDFAGDVRDGIVKIPEKIQALADKVKSVGSAIISPFRDLADFIGDAIDLVGDLIDKLQSAADLIPDFDFGFRVAAPTATTSGVPAATTQVVVQVQGPIIGTTEARVGLQLLDAINRGRRDLGLAPL